jgi:hypothetical protein
MGGLKSEKVACPKYTIQQFARLSFDVISSVKLPAAKTSQVFFPLNPL